MLQNHNKKIRVIWRPRLKHKNALPINEKPITLSLDKTKKAPTFKVLQRETSVYKYYVELKDDVLTEFGYLDLIKVPCLFISGAGPFLKDLRRKNCLRQKDIAKILKVSRSSVKDWERSYRNIPLQCLVKIAEINGISKNTIYSLIDQSKFSLKRITLPVKFEKIHDFVQYIRPQKDCGAAARMSILKPHHEETISKIQEVFNIKPWSRGNKHRIDSRELYNYLTTFLRYTKIPKINFPLTSEVKQLYEQGVDLKRAIIIPCLQSDGNILRAPYKYGLRFFGNSKILHDYFVDAIYYEYDLLPTSYFLEDKNNNIYYTKYDQRVVNEIIDEVTNLAGNTKTSPANKQTIEDYLKEPQPHLKYLLNASKTEQKIALRIWMSTEGCVSVHRSHGIIYPYLLIACAHPILAKQLQQIAKTFSFPLHIRHSKLHWAGIDSVYNKTIRGCIEFLKFGGLIKGVKISSKSRYHEGIEKNILMLGILEYIKQRKTTNKWLEKQPKAQHHYNINKIIENEEYNPKMDYYIDFFSEYV